MSLPWIILVAVGLAMDSLAVSIAIGFKLKKVSVPEALRPAVFFGGFQALMPLIGAGIGVKLKSVIESYDHWVVMAILGFIGAKMIWESFEMEKKNDDEKNQNPLGFRNLTLLAVATSIDALAVGISLPLLGLQNICLAVGIIGTVTFALCLAGVLIGDLVGHFFERKIEILGGLILIGIGVKTLFEHLMT